MEGERLSETAHRHGIRLMVRFGSTVTGKTHPGSDLDLAVLLDHAPASWDAQASLLAELQEIHPGCEIDVAIINRADPLFLKQITQHCELVFGSMRDLHELKIYAYKRYQDHRRYLELERKYVERVAGAAAP